MSRKVLDVDQEEMDQFAALQEQIGRLTEATDLSNAENGRLKSENTQLKREIAVLKQKPEIELAEVPKTPCGYLLFFIAIIWARMALFVTVEQSGKLAPIEGLLVNIVFGGVVLIMLWKWGWENWQIFEWSAIPNALIVLVTVLICVDGVTGGAALNGHAVYIAIDPITATITATIGLLMACTKFWVWLFDRTAAWLNDPLAPIRHVRATMDRWDREAKEEEKQKA